MKLADAKAECERWLAHCDRQRERSVALQKLAAERRAGTVSDHQVRGRLSQIEGQGVRVYDGANLEQAVKVLLKHI